MVQPPEHNHNLSMWLSEVLQDIGVSVTLVEKRRRMWMIIEAIENTQLLLLNLTRKLKTYYFGSQTEASTTLGLNSDIDCLTYPQEVCVIQNLSQRKLDVKQYLMVQDETVSPGYCLLQPLPKHHIHDEFLRTDSRGRVLLEPSVCLMRLHGGTVHGPAESSRYGDYDRDDVVGFYCPSWPKEAIPWLQQQTNSGWPTKDMKKYSADQGCFVVPVGSKKGLYQDLEWRISTSLAERYLMYNLNITQIRCYILMKMIIKTFLKPKCGEAVSSYMCKNILFDCIAGSEMNSTWNESSLLTRLNQCLQALHRCIQTENCPHFVIPRNNLLAGKLSAKVKRQIAEVMLTITGNIEHSLLGIQIDNLGHRLHVKLGGISTVTRSAEHNAFITAIRLIEMLSVHLRNNIALIHSKIPQNGDANDQYFTHMVSKLVQLEGSEAEKAAVSLQTPFLCTTIGSIKASADIHHNRDISLDAFTWLSWGLNSDFSSGKLKLASALYCAGDLESCEKILGFLSLKKSSTTVQYICFCNPTPANITEHFRKLCLELNEETIKYNIAFCVKYMQCEINCIPDQLKYEMFRSTEEDRPYRHPRRDIWMDWAVVDFKPYLYFLQYKVYSQLHRPADQHRALDNLVKTIEADPVLGHKETALNLLGQCMEQKNWLQVALYCYKMSLTLRRRNNAAKWHVCRLLACLFRSRSQ